MDYIHINTYIHPPVGGSKEYKPLEGQGVSSREIIRCTVISEVVWLDEGTTV